jgi:hypothetical protein
MPKILAERRERRVMFRLSEEEHEKLKRLCLITHRRSVSELVRLVIEQWMEKQWMETRGAPLVEEAGAVADLRAKVRRLESRVDSMTARIQMFRRTN